MRDRFLVIFMLAFVFASLTPLALQLIWPSIILFGLGNATMYVQAHIQPQKDLRAFLYLMSGTMSLCFILFSVLLLTGQF